MDWQAEDWQVFGVLLAIAAAAWVILMGAAFGAVRLFFWLDDRNKRMKLERRRIASRERQQRRREKRQAELAVLFAAGLKPQDGNVQVFTGESYLTERRGAGVYRQSKATPKFKTLKKLKYGGVDLATARELAQPLAAQLAHTYRKSRWKVDIVVCVPSSAERLKERGFNQSELLARMFSRLAWIPYRDVLTRRFEVEQAQAALRTAKERAANLEGIFAAQGVAGLRVLIVDDVSTTGTTLNECAKALRQGGAVEVYGLTLFSGVSRKPRR
jgi:ComF family protein